MPLITRVACGLALAVLSFGAYGCGGGCGEAPQPQSQAPTTSGAGGGGGGSSGGGSVDVGPGSEEEISRSVAQQAPKMDQPPKNQPAAAKPSMAAVYEEVDKASYDAKVNKAISGVLVVSYTPQCQRWQEVDTALKGVSQDLAGRVAIYRLNVADPEQAKLLPAGMTSLPVPGFAYYESGQALVQRQGLPFDHRAGKEGEPLENAQQYQARLRTWLSQAVPEKNFYLPEPK
jgi:hypothetical protein